MLVVALFDVVYLSQESLQ